MRTLRTFQGKILLLSTVSVLAGLLLALVASLFGINRMRRGAEAAFEQGCMNAQRDNLNRNLQLAAEHVDLWLGRPRGDLAILAEITQGMVDHADHLQPVLDILNDIPFFHDALSCDPDYGFTENSPDEPTGITIQTFLHDENGAPKPEALDVLRRTRTLDFYMPPVQRNGAPKLRMYFIGPPGVSVVRIAPWTDVRESLTTYPDFLEKCYWDFYGGLIGKWRQWLRRPEGPPSGAQAITQMRPYIDGPTGALVETAMCPIWNADRSDIAGGVGYDIDLEVLVDFITGIRIAQTGFAVLAHGDGNVLAISDHGLDLLGLRDGARYDSEFCRVCSFADSTVPAVRGLAGQIGEEAGFKTLDLDGQPHLVATRRLAPVSTRHGASGAIDHEDWLLTLVVPRQEVLAPVRAAEARIARDTRGILGWQIAIFVATLLALTTLLYAVSRRMTGDLVSLARGAERIMDGDYSARTEVRAFDEIGRVGKAFNAMATHLQENFQKIEAQNRVLQEGFEARARLTAAIEQASEMVMVTDREGKVEYVNPAFEAATGYSREEIRGRTPRILKSGRHDEGFYRDLWETVLDGRVWRGSFTNRRKDGSLFEEDATITPVFGDSGEIVNFIGLKRDITRQRRLEEDLRQLQKMEAIGQLAGGVAHDFSNMVQVISGYVTLAMEGLDPRDPRYRDLDQVREATGRATALTRQLLAFSRRGDIEPTDVNVNQLVTDLLKMLRRLIGEHIGVGFSPAKGLGRVHADPAQLEQVLINLCLNARDAMPEGGRIEITTVARDLDKEFCAANPWARPGRFVSIRVQDDGEGMDEETLSHVFEPFFTTKETDRGTGLGLATVYGIVTQHEGLIHAESAPGEGAMFEVYFPVTAGEEVRMAAAAESGKVVGGKETLLFAEDDPILRNLTGRILREAGYEVLLASDGLKAVRTFEANADRVALAVLDVVMPGMGGGQVYERIERLRPGTPVLYCTGYSVDGLQNSPRGPEGRSEILRKPFSPRVLLATVREMIDRCQA